MCEYCNNKPNPIVPDIKPLARDIRYGGFEVELYEMNSIWSLDIDYNGMYEGNKTSITINFCPMCGRKLKGELK